MSFDINWQKLISDNEINEWIRDFLDEQLNSVKLPSFIDKLSVIDFHLGLVPPNITIRHIDDPFEEFYHETKCEDDAKRFTRSMTPGFSESDSDSSDDEQLHSTFKEIDYKDIFPTFSPPTTETDSGRNPEHFFKHFHNYTMNNVGLGHHEIETPANLFAPNAYSFKASSSRHAETRKSENDIQFILEIDYKGDATLEVMVNLQVNYPSSHFISLPIKLKLSDLVIHSLAAVAYLEKSIYITFLCDLNETASDYFTKFGSNIHGMNNVNGEYSGPGNRERIDVIRSVKIDTEIGEMENNVLRNVGKVEKFLVEQIRSIIRDEIAWPNWICLDLNEEDEEEEEDRKEENKEEEEGEEEKEGEEEEEKEREKEKEAEEHEHEGDRDRNKTTDDGGDGGEGGDDGDGGGGGDDGVDGEDGDNSDNGDDGDDGDDDGVDNNDGDDDEDSDGNGNVNGDGDDGDEESDAGLIDTNSTLLTDGAKI